MKRFTDLVEACLHRIEELFPWDLCERMARTDDVLLVDVREPQEFDRMHIAGSINVPRGVLETACEYGYEDTVPELARARDRDVVVICRSGQRSVLAAHTMMQLGYARVWSLKTGLRGWNDYEQPLVDGCGKSVDLDTADEYFTVRLRPDQVRP